MTVIICIFLIALLLGAGYVTYALKLRCPKCSRVMVRKASVRSLAGIVPSYDEYECRNCGYSERWLG